MFQIKASDTCEFRIYNETVYEDSGIIPLDAMKIRTVHKYPKASKWKLHFSLLGIYSQMFNCRISSPINPNNKTRDFDYFIHTRLNHSKFGPLQPIEFNVMYIELSHGTTENFFSYFYLDLSRF